jgi:hypothetical protein
MTNDGMTNVLQASAFGFLSDFTFKGRTGSSTGHGYSHATAASAKRLECVRLVAAFEQRAGRPKPVPKQRW